MSLIEHLKRLTWEGATARWPAGVPEKIIALLRHEIPSFRNWVMKPISSPSGTWSASHANAIFYVRVAALLQTLQSVIALALPMLTKSIDLLFERFISRERDEAPDIDVDFEHQRREEVLQYLYEKYGGSCRFNCNSHHLSNQKCNP